MSWPRTLPGDRPAHLGDAAHVPAPALAVAATGTETDPGRPARARRRCRAVVVNADGPPHEIDAVVHPVDAERRREPRRTGAQVAVPARRDPAGAHHVEPGHRNRG